MPAKGRRVAKRRELASPELITMLIRLLGRNVSCVVSDEGAAVNDKTVFIGTIAGELGATAACLHPDFSRTTPLLAVTQAIVSAVTEYAYVDPRTSEAGLYDIARSRIDDEAIDLIVISHAERCDKAALELFDPQQCGALVWLACANSAALRTVDSPLLANAVWMSDPNSGFEAKPALQPLVGPELHTHVDLIQTREKSALDALYVDGQSGGLLGLRLSDTCAVIQRGALETLHARLKKLGHTPSIGGSAL